METPVLIPNTEVKRLRADGTRKGRVGRRQHKEQVLYMRMEGVAQNGQSGTFFVQVFGSSPNPFLYMWSA